MKKMFSFKYNSIVSSKALMLVDCLNTFVHDCKLPERELVRKTVSVLSKKKKRWVVASIFRLATLHKCWFFIPQRIVKIESYDVWFFAFTLRSAWFI